MMTINKISDNELERIVEEKFIINRFDLLKKKEQLLIQIKDIEELLKNFE